MVHILMVLSNTCASPSTVDFALDLARKEQASVTGLFVVDPKVAERMAAQLSDTGFVGDQPSQKVQQVIEEEYRAQAQKLLADAKKRFDDAGLAFRAELREGDFTSICLQMAEELKVDRAVVCARPISNLRRWLMGSQVDELLAGLSCPTDVIRDESDV